MSYIFPDFDSINEDALAQLKTNQVPEGKAIEYKLTLELKAVDKKGVAGWQKFLKEITAFANGSGGDLLYGIEATDGLPTGIPGLSALNFDATVLQLQNLIRSHVQPRLFGVRYRSVPLANGNTALAIRVPRASGPFMLENRFYLRTGPEARPMDFVEVSRAFFESEATSNQLRNFRFERCAAILSNEAALEMRDKSFVVLHVVPLEAVGQPHRFSIQELLQWRDQLWPMNSSSANCGICLDGVFKYDQAAKSKTASTYSMLMRSGAIEAVEGSWLEPHRTEDKSTLRYIPTDLEPKVVETLTGNLGLLTTMEFNPPYATFLSLLNTKGFECPVDSIQSRFRSGSKTIRADYLYLPEIIIEDPAQDLHKAMKPIFDGIWNACGLAGSHNYDDKGEWSPRR